MLSSVFGHIRLSIRMPAKCLPLHKKNSDIWVNLNNLSRLRPLIKGIQDKFIHYPKLYFASNSLCWLWDAGGPSAILLIVPATTWGHFLHYRTLVQALFALPIRWLKNFGFQWEEKCTTAWKELFTVPSQFLVFSTAGALVVVTV